MKYIDDFIKYLDVVRKYSNYTLVNYRKDIEDFYDFNTDLLNIDEVIVREYLQYLYSNNLERRTISRKLSSLRSFYNYLTKEELIDTNYFKDVSNPKKANVLPHDAKISDIEKIFAIFDIKKCFDERNLLMLKILYSTGIRVGELVNIKVNDIDFYDCSIKIFGKGAKERIVFFSADILNSINHYLKAGRIAILKNKQSEFLFINKNGEKISTRFVRKIIDDVSNRCMIEYNITPHTFRHTFATQMLKNGADLMSVKELLGHSSINTTSIYTHLSNEQIRNVYNFAHPRASSNKE